MYGPITIFLPSCISPYELTNLARSVFLNICFFGYFKSNCLARDGVKPSRKRIFLYCPLARSKNHIVGILHCGVMGENERRDIFSSSISIWLLAEKSASLTLFCVLAYFEIRDTISL